LKLNQQTKMLNLSPSQPSKVPAIFATAVLFIVTALAAHANQPAPNQGTAKFETRFLTGMIDHHHMAIMMAELCPGRASHPELLQLCDSIRTSQSAEMESMTGWLRDWYGINYEPEMKPADERMLAEMAAMSGEEFEIEFMEMMIEHHGKAIKEAEKCEPRAFHAPLRQLCQNIINTQSAELSQMRRWLCIWYAICK
jgi:uncharacterized protein (DUF305 family)